MCGGSVWAAVADLGLGLLVLVAEKVGPAWHRLLTFFFGVSPYLPLYLDKYTKFITRVLSLFAVIMRCFLRRADLTCSQVAPNSKLIQ